MNTDGISWSLKRLTIGDLAANPPTAAARFLKHPKASGIFWRKPTTTRTDSREFFDENGNSLPVLTVFNKYTLPLPRKADQ